MTKSGKVISFEEMIGEEPDMLNQCPCSPACKCAMDDPCKGCETYGKWLKENKDGS
jgi:hypothetical protein